MLVHQFVRICRNHPYYTYIIDNHILCLKQKRITMRYYLYAIKRILLPQPDHIVFDLYNEQHPELYDPQNVTLYKKELLNVLDASVLVNIDPATEKEDNAIISGIWIEGGKIIF